MSQLFLFPDAVRRSAEIETWIGWQKGELGGIAKHWLGFLRACGDDVREVLHDGHPTVCVGDAAFAYVDTFTAHVNVGFFHGADLPDPNCMLEGSGKVMRHVKVRPGATVDANGLSTLIQAAYADMKQRASSRAADGANAARERRPKRPGRRL